jgi:hypothetical protein
VKHSRIAAETGDIVMTDAFIIETATVTAGIVAAHGRGFRFYASHPSMFVLEGQVFDSPKAAQNAAEKVANMPGEKPFRRREGLSRWGYPSKHIAEAG